MPSRETIEQAHYIFKTGKLIRDRIFRIQTRLLAHDADRGKYRELSMPQVHAIMVARDRGEATITEIAGVLGVSLPSASAMVDRLVEKGILVRRQDPRDRRRVLVSVSPRAVKEIEKVHDSILQSFVDLVEKIGPETTAKWCDVLRHVNQVLENEQAGPRAPETSGRKTP